MKPGSYAIRTQRDGYFFYFSRGVFPFMFLRICDRKVAGNIMGIHIIFVVMIKILRISLCFWRQVVFASGYKWIG